MPREKEAFRDQLEEIKKAFPDAQLLRKKDVQKFTGLCPDSVRKFIKFNSFGMITPADLARQLLS